MELCHRGKKPFFFETGTHIYIHMIGAVCIDAPLYHEEIYGASHCAENDSS